MFMHVWKEMNRFTVTQNLQDPGARPASPCCLRPGGAPAWSGILDFRAEWNQTGFCQKGVEVGMGGVGGVNRQRVAGLALGAPQLIHTDGKH